MCHDQCVFRIDRSLDVVRRQRGLTHQHVPSVRFRMLLQLLKCSLHGRRINVCLLFFVGFLDAVKIAQQSESLASAVDARHSTKFRAVDGDPLTSDKSAVACKANKFCAGTRHCVTVHPPKFSNTLVGWIQAPEKPHQLNVPPALRFQPPRRANLIQVAVEIELQ